jgi:glycosyltransferase involved in cell wall biosynthesis
MILITIPAYNEGGTIGNIIGQIKEVMDECKWKYKVLVVDDGSLDKTAIEAKDAGAVVYSHPRNYGLAETFKTEIEKSIELKAEIIVHIDADGQYKAEEIPKLIDEVKNGYDLVLGSRFKGRIESMPFINWIGNKAFSRVISQVTGIRISDAQTGFRAFTKEVAQKILITSNHTYTQEQIIKAVKQKFKIREVPIFFAKRIHGKSRLIKNPLRYATRAWIDIFRIYRDFEPLKFFGLFGGSFFTVGFLIGLFILYTFMVRGYVGGLPRVLLSVLFMSMGVQIFLFGFLADMGRK